MYPEFIQKIDWELLRVQKRVIIELSAMGCFTTEDYDAFEGLLNLLDALQDYAVDEMGMKDEDVFGQLEDTFY